MFHILTPKSVPPYLCAGYGTIPASTVLCSAKVGERREAISYEEALGLLNKGKLYKERACSKCLKSIGGGSKRGEREDS